jgi:hypothetical protein
MGHARKYSEPLLHRSGPIGNFRVATIRDLIGSVNTSAFCTSNSESGENLACSAVKFKTPESDATGGRQSCRTFRYRTPGCTNTKGSRYATRDEECRVNATGSIFLWKILVTV